MKSILALVLGLFLFMGVAPAGEYDKVSLTFSLNGTDTSIEARVVNLFTRLVEERSGGAIRIRSFPNAQLAGGNLAKSVEIATMGTVDLACWSQGVLAAIDESLFAAGLPFTYADYAEAERIYETTAGKYLTESLARHNLTYITYAHNGIKAMTCSKRLITTPADLLHLKMRVSGGALNLDFYSALGADPIAMNWSEVYTALQQGTIDGQDNSLVTIKSNNIQEVQKYMTISKHMYDAFLFAACTRRFAALSKDTRDLIISCLQEASRTVNAEVVAQEVDVRAEFEKIGIEFYDFTPTDTAAFKAVVQPVIDKYKARYGAETCAAFGIK